MTSHDSKYDLLQQEINMTSLTSELRRLQLAEMPKQQDQDTSDGLSPKVSGDHLISQTRSFLSLALEVREKIYELCFRDRLFTMHYRGTCKTRPDSQRAVSQSIGQYPRNLLLVCQQVFYEAHPFFIELGRFRPAKCLHPLMFKLNPTHKHKTPHISDWVLTRIRHFEIGRSRNFSFLDCIVASHRRVPVDHPVVVELVEMIFRKAPEKRLLESLCEKVRGTRIELLMPLADVGNPHSTYQMRYNAAEHRMCISGCPATVYANIQAFVRFHWSQTFWLLLRFGHVSS